MKIIKVIAEGGLIIGTEWLVCAESVHRQLRPQLPTNYVTKMIRVSSDAHRSLAIKNITLFGLAVYRWHENTFDDLKFYIDDLVKRNSRRSEGVVYTLITHLEAVAKEKVASGAVLDSGTQRTWAHMFYFREGFIIPAFNFKKTFT